MKLRRVFVTMFALKKKTFGTLFESRDTVILSPYQISECAEQCLLRWRDCSEACSRAARSGYLGVPPVQVTALMYGLQ